MVQVKGYGRRYAASRGGRRSAFAGLRRDKSARPTGVRLETQVLNENRHALHHLWEVVGDVLHAQSQPFGLMIRVGIQQALSPMLQRLHTQPGLIQFDVSDRNGLFQVVDRNQADLVLIAPFPVGTDTVVSPRLTQQFMKALLQEKTAVDRIVSSASSLSRP